MFSLFFPCSLFFHLRTFCSAHAEDEREGLPILSILRLIYPDKSLDQIKSLTVAEHKTNMAARVAAHQEVLAARLEAEKVRLQEQADALQAELDAAAAIIEAQGSVASAEQLEEIAMAQAAMDEALAKLQELISPPADGAGGAGQPPPPSDNSTTQARRKRSVSDCSGVLAAIGTIKANTASVGEDGEFDPAKMAETMALSESIKNLDVTPEQCQAEIGEADLEAARNEIQEVKEVKAAAQAVFQKMQIEKKVQDDAVRSILKSMERIQQLQKLSSVPNTCLLYTSPSPRD